MKFLVDAQLPRRFCVWLVEAGHDAFHTLDMPQGNRTSDTEILDVAQSEQRIVVTRTTILSVLSDYRATTRFAACFDRKYLKR